MIGPHDHLPKISRGNPLFVSCAITDLADNSAADDLTVTAFIGQRKNSTTPIDDALSVDAVKRESDQSTTSRLYDATFTGDDITTLLEPYDEDSVWVIFECPENDFRCELEYCVTPGQSG